MLKNLKKFTGFFQKKLRIKREKIKAPAVVFLDNRFPDFFNQIDYLFSSGFLPEGTAIITRYRKSNHKNILAGVEPFGAKVYTFTTLANIPIVRPGAVIIYPYNAQTNNRMMLNRRCVHVFIGHGDSNKKASVNPLLRAFDYVLIAGELSRKRLLDQGVLRPQLTREHTIAIGATVIDQRHSRLYDYAKGADGGALAYLPTWEGGLKAENYCTVAETNTASFLIRLAKKLETRTIILDVHPNLGQRQARYKTRFTALVMRLLDSGFTVKLRQKGGTVEGLRVIRKLVERGRLELLTGRTDICYAIVDVSAAEGIIAAQNIPSAVVYRSETSFYSGKSYMDIRGDAIISIQDDASINKFFDFVGTPEDEEKQKLFAQTLFSCDDEEMNSLDDPAKWNYLVKNYFFPEVPEEEAEEDGAAEEKEEKSAASEEEAAEAE